MKNAIIIVTVSLPIYDQEFDWFILSDASEMGEIAEEVFSSIEKCFSEKGVTIFTDIGFKIKAIIPFHNPLLSDFTDYIE